MDLNKLLKIVLMVAVFVIAGSVFYRYAISLPREERIKSELAEQQRIKEIEELQKQKEEMEKQIAEAGGKADEETRKQISELEQQIKSLEGQKKEENQVPDLSSIITKWRPYIAYIECDFTYTNGVKYLTKSGSGLVVILNSSDVVVFTNRHVVLDGEYTPESCAIKIPDDNNIFLATYSEGDFIISYSESDSAFIKVRYPDNYIKTLTFSESANCKERAPVGGSLVILGYPGIGSKTDITATEGIISGYDGDYYITSAKVEHGNSGGAAILLEDNCYLGIPTFVEIGGMESLARILSIERLLKQTY